MSSSFFFTATPSTEIYTLSLHDALPIFERLPVEHARVAVHGRDGGGGFVDVEGADLAGAVGAHEQRSEEHTSELQSHHDLVCRLLLEKKKKNTYDISTRARTTRQPSSPY